MLHLSPITDSLQLFPIKEKKMHYNYPDQLIVLLYICGMGGIVCLSVLLAGFTTTDGASLTATQRARYIWAALAVPVAAAFLYVPLHKYGFAACTGALGEARAADFFFGWGLTISFYALVASPLLTALIWLWIYFVPTRYAKSQHGTYPLTSQVRFRRRRKSSNTHYLHRS
jgi:hypothetical protein